eukprot:snap_masked-scaffold252_size238019-processed-gene-1.18 protein:Tk06205 transcript:snap_masked-scaffold252_size238019-processed-gene-1.18-mRNA-1 annotation:"dna polymerase alpha catalytic subunit"
MASLLDQVKPKTGSAAGQPARKTPKATPKATPKSSASQNPFARPKSTGILKPKAPLTTRNPEHDEAMDMLSSLDDEGMPAEVTPSQCIEDEEPSQAEDLAAMLEADDDFHIDEEPSSQVNEPENRGFQKAAKPKTDLTSWTGPEDSKAFGATTQAATMAEVKLESGDLPLITNHHGDQVLRMYWLDAFEDPFKAPGKVWLFGKVFVPQAKAHVSCCLQVSGIQRRVFMLKRESRYDLKAKCDTGLEVAMADVYNEFATKTAARYKIPEYRSKVSTMKYAFEYTDVPDSADYLEVQYDPQFPALPSNLTGETFSRVFGANQSSLEHFLISKRFKGPAWIDIKNPGASKAPMSWCKLEVLANDPDDISLVLHDTPTSPPITVMSLNMKTTINPKSMLNEIAMVSALVHDEVFLDRPAPKEPFKYHFSALTRPSDQIWPFDFQSVVSQSNGIKVDKMDSERALLGFVLAKIQKIDPDIIIGHDITGFDLEVLLHRAVSNKVPHWSRLGRLRRSQPPMFKGKLAEKIAVTGRLVCDLKISAKELIRSKSYELGVLIEKLLGKPVEDRVDIGCEEMRRAYESSKSLIHVAQLSSEDALDTLKAVYELNALPLALQITQVAGNVMSRTLLGGRAERNEYLLLHAFNDRGYIFPDKTYGKKHAKTGGDFDEGDLAAVETQKSGRKKPAYTGGLVLEPKKGFYDHFILLMDFNSLYPSIIQS